MKRHVRNLMRHMGYTEGDVILCEIRGKRCQNVAVDVHHIVFKGMGGGNKDDKPSNLAFTCRACHEDAHSYKITKEQIFERISHRTTNEKEMQ